jgi:hypothetical protein
MQINKPGLIVPIMVVGGYILRYGIDAYTSRGLSGYNVAAIVAGFVLLVLALAITLKGSGELGKMFQIVIVSLIGVYVMCLGLTDLYDHPNIFKYASASIGVIIVFIAFILAYKEYGHYDLNLRSQD